MIEYILGLIGASGLGFIIAYIVCANRCNRNRIDDWNNWNAGKFEP